MRHGIVEGEPNVIPSPLRFIQRLLRRSPDTPAREDRVVSNLKTVQAVYEAFGRGDIPAIIDRLADDVRWDDWDPPGPAHTVVPQLLRRTNKAEVGDFFATLAGLEFHGFEVKNLLEGGDQVAAVLDVDATVTATGTRVKDLEIHLWTFGADGKVIEFRHVVDTAKHLDAHTP